MKKKFLSTLINLISKKLGSGFFLGQLGIRPIRNSNMGFSVIEVILAAAIFMIFATGAAGVVIQGLSSNRQGEEQTVANQYAAEGLEAVRSIKNQSFTNLINSAGTGIIRSGIVWAFGGLNNTFSPNPNKTYTRVIKVEDVYRDVNENIVTSGGTLDNNSKKITSTVTWDFSPSRNNSVVLTTYLTNYRKPIIVDGGMLAYGDGTAIPEHRIYETVLDKFSKQVALPTGASGNTFVLRTSPVKGEAIAGYVTASGTLQILCFNGETWSNEWTVDVGKTGTTRRFDIAYETNSADVMVLYSTNLFSTNELAYRTKPGSAGCGSSNWALPVNFNPLRTSGIIQWVKMAWDRRSSSNLITAIWADGYSDLSAAVWSGSVWGNEPSTATETSLEVVAASQDVDDFDVEYESLSGDVMVVWANSAGSDGINGVRYRTCNGGTATCTWSAVTTPPTWEDDATNLDISANPNTDQIVFASIGNAGSDLQTGYWNGSTWSNTKNTDTSCITPVAGSKKVATGWLISGTAYRSIVVYNDNAVDISYYSGDGGTFKVGSFHPDPTPNIDQVWLDIQMDPLTKRYLLLTLSDINKILYAKRLWYLRIINRDVFAWTDADKGGLTPSLSQAINSPFSFAYWRSLAD